MPEETLSSTNVVSILSEPSGLGEASAEKLVSEIVAKTGVRKKTAEKIAKAIAAPDCNILNDLPVAEDTFGFAVVAKTVSNIILSAETQTPLSIAVDGPWGSGKTSLLKMIEAQVRTVGTPCLWVNAWSFESAENLIATISSQVRAEIKRSRAQPAFGFRDAFDHLVLALSTFGEALTIPMGGVFAGLVKAQIKYGREVTKLASVVATNRSFESLIETLLQNMKHPTPRVVIFIDDLDRALPDQIVAILKNLKLVLEAKGCVFVLAMDVDVVASSIEAHYRREVVALNEGNDQEGESGRFGPRYLEKITQLRVKVPDLTRDEVDRYVAELGVIRDVRDIINFAPDHDTLNPRRLKRYINWLSITMQLIASLPLPEGVSNITALQAIALKRHYPEVYKEYLRRGVVDSDEAFRQYVVRLPIQELRNFNDFLQLTPVLEAAQLEIHDVPTSRRDLLGHSSIR